MRQNIILFQTITAHFADLSMPNNFVNSSPLSMALQFSLGFILLFSFLALKLIDFLTFFNNRSKTYINSTQILRDPSLFSCHLECTYWHLSNL